MMWPVNAYIGPCWPLRNAENLFYSWKAQDCGFTGSRSNNIYTVRLCREHVSSILLMSQGVPWPVNYIWYKKPHPRIWFYLDLYTDQQLTKWQCSLIRGTGRITCQHSCWFMMSTTALLFQWRVIKCFFLMEYWRKKYISGLKFCT